MLHYVGLEVEYDTGFGTTLKGQAFYEIRIPVTEAERLIQMLIAPESISEI